MTTLQILVMTCAYAVAFAAVIYFTRATPRRVAGALAGGAAAGCWGLGAIIVGEAIGVWRDFLPSAHRAWVLFYLGLAISLSPIYLITWRAARRFGWRGLGVCLIVAGVVGPPRDYLYVATYPAWGAFAQGVAPVLADAATYVGIVALGHAVMRLVSGPALGSRLARQPSSFGALWRGHVFLFDKKREPATFGDAAGARLLLIVAGLEIIRLFRTQLMLSSLPFWLEVPIYLVLALLGVRFVARVEWAQIGFRRWPQWNATERSYFVQVLLLVNVVFLVLFGARLRAALADPSAILTIFVPYLVYGFYQEVLYRGMLQTELVRRWDPLTGILVSNLLFTFGPLHYYYLFSKASLAVPMFAAIFAVGLLFAVVFHRAGNLWIVATMHAFGNAYAVGAVGLGQ